MSGPVQVERFDNGTLLVRLDRPDRLNALSDELMDDLASLWHEVAADPSVRAVVLTGNGRGFCSGADVDFLAADRAPRGTGARGIESELNFLPGPVVGVPVLVAVNGVCAGGGLHFVADADIVIAGRAASFLDPHVSVGQVSGIEPASLALRLPVGVIARMALLGAAERFGAERAYELGLVSEVVDDDVLVTRALELSAAIAAASPQAVRITRAALRRLSDGVVLPAMRSGWADVQGHWGHPDASEGPRAFAEGRPATWTEPDGT